MDIVIWKVWLVKAQITVKVVNLVHSLRRKPHESCDCVFLFFPSVYTQQLAHAWHVLAI